MAFINRAEAGRYLAERLQAYAGDDVVVLGLPRGGVPVAFEVARVLGAPLDVIVVRKLGVPFQPELAMGAIGEGGARTINDEIVRATQVTPDQVAAVEAAELSVRGGAIGRQRRAVVGARERGRRRAGVGRASVAGRAGGAAAACAKKGGRERAREEGRE